jgi:hypothetical protein
MTSLLAFMYNGCRLPTSLADTLAIVLSEFVTNFTKPILARKTIFEEDGRNAQSLLLAIETVTETLPQKR